MVYADPFVSEFINLFRINGAIKERPLLINRNIADFFKYFQDS
jgi:hypothetical protein